MLKRPNSTISLRDKNPNFNFRNNNNYYFNTQNNNLNFQSPKISSGKMRYILEDKKLFSLIDLNEKITNSKGPSLPIQFKRLNSKEIHDLFNGDSAKVYEKYKKMKYSNFLNKIKIPKVKENDSNTKIIKSENNAIDEEKNDTEVNVEKFSSHTEQGIGIKLNNKKDEILKRPNTSRLNNLNKKKFEIFEGNKENKNYKNDIWMPTNYRNYEQIVKDRQLFIKKMKENSFFNRLPSCTIKDIQSKNYNTDIFIVKPQNSQSKLNPYMKYKQNIKNNNNTYYNSDIFNVKNDEMSLQKIGEKFLFNTQPNFKYTPSRESKSDWEGKISKDSINNCSSKDYNILAPNRKNNNLMKETIYKTFDETNNNKDNPIYKLKGVCKYIDLANNSSSNFGKDYMKCYNLNPNCFKKIPENCSSFGDLFLQYKNICDRPFYKKGFLA